MYDRRVREEFWTTFGKYMSHVPSASGEKVNWINYKTGVKHLQFRMEADDHKAVISIEVTHPDTSTRSRMFQQLLADQAQLEANTDHQWKWHPSVVVDGREFSRIIQERPGLNVYTRSDWPGIISFFKPLLIGLDSFWTEQRDIYEYIS